MRAPLLTAIVGIGLVAVAPPSARAGNDDELFAGNHAAMMAGAVSASVDDTSAAWYNPAGLGAITRSQVDVSGTVYTLRFYRVPDFMTLGTGEGDDASVTEFVSIPTQIVYGRALASHVTLALGYFVPQATNVVLRERLAADNAQGHSEWEVAIATSRVLHNGVAALGFEPARHLRLGVSLIGSYQDESESSVVFGAAAPDTEVERLYEFTALGTGGRAALELGAGVQLDLSDRLSVALSGRSPRVQVARSADYVLTTGFGLGPNAGGPELSGMSVPVAGSERTLALIRAGRVGLGFSYRYTGTSHVSAEVDVQPALRDAEQNVRRRAVVNARLGVYHALTSSVALGAGVFTDRAPDELDGSPGNGTGDFYGGTFGVEISNEHRLAHDELADSLVFSTVFAVRYAFSDGDFMRFESLDELLTTATDPSGRLGADVRGAPGALIAHEVGLYVGGGLKF